MFKDENSSYFVQCEFIIPLFLCFIDTPGRIVTVSYLGSNLRVLDDIVYINHKIESIKIRVN